MSKSKLYYENDVFMCDGNKLVEPFSGEGAFYSKEGELVYEGEFKNTTFDGLGKSYSNGQLIYEGSYSNNKFSGFGKWYHDGQLLYEGNFANGMYNGLGKKYSKGELVYDGNFLNNKFDGFGKWYKDGQLVYEGNFSNSQYNGLGKKYSKGQLIYDGNFVNNNYNGFGKYYSNGKLLYEGNFIDNQFDGDGLLYCDNGKIRYKGYFSNTAIGTRPEYLKKLNSDDKNDYGMFFGHSGFLIELSNSTLIFDYIYGELPEIREDKPLYIFISHCHSDHCNWEKIIEIYDKSYHTEIFFGYDYSDSSINETLDNLPSKIRESVSCFKGEQQLYSDDSLVYIKSLISTDLGVAFLVKCNGKVIFHAGDLAIWDRGLENFLNARLRYEVDESTGRELYEEYMENYKK